MRNASSCWRRAVVVALCLLTMRHQQVRVHGFALASSPHATTTTKTATPLAFSSSTTSTRSSPSTTTALQAAGLTEAYEYCLTYHHLPTVSLTSAVCGGVGDFAAQCRNRKSSSSSSSIDWNNNRIFWLKGSLGGVIWSQWYAFLDPVTAAAAGPGAAPWLAAALSTAAEQFLFCPLIFAAYDLPLPLLLRGDPVDRIPAQVRTKLGPVLLENAKVWTLANMVVYSAPLQWRVLISGVAEAVWQMLLAQQLAPEAEPTTTTTTKQQQPDVYLPLADSIAMEQQQESPAAQRASSLNRRLMDPVAVEQR